MSGKDPYRYFRVEARELLEALGAGLLELERGPPEPHAVVQRLLRHAHTLKGAARVVGRRDIADAVHVLEGALAAHREPGAPLPPERVGPLLAQLDAVSAAVAALDAPAPAGAAPPAAGATASPAPAARGAVPSASSAGPAASPASAAGAAASSASAAAAAATPASAAGAAASSASAAPAAEARGLASGTPGLEAHGPASGTAGPEGRGPTASVAEAPASATALAEAPSAPSDAAAPHAVPPRDATAPLLRVGLDEVDALLDEVGGLGARLAPLQRASEALAAAQDEARRGATAAALAGRLRSARALVDEALAGTAAAAGGLREGVHALRLLPVSGIFLQLERACRDAAAQAGKRVRFEEAGGENRVDAPVLGAVRDALLHLVRNAVDHGLEAPAERAAVGKPPEGRVRVAVERERGNRLRFVCEDDGRGVDAAGVARAAERLGLQPAEGADAALELIFTPGLSTAPEVTELSGRGVGLDAVRDLCARLHATVSVRSTPGRGAAFSLSVPASLSAVSALRVHAGGAAYALPLASVTRTVRLTAADRADSPAGEAVVVDGRVLPFVDLARRLGGGGGPPRPRERQTAVLLEAGAGALALGVDALGRVEHLLLRPVPSALAGLPVLATAFDAHGDPEPLLDPAGLLALPPAAAPPVAARARPRVLVVDDSLTTRMLEKGILEAAGYAVDLAASGEEGLERAAAARYDLFVVDVEMPGISGLDFVRRTRADAGLARTPAVLVTSLGAPEDRARGAAAGASGYVVKSEFSQRAFLELVARLTGGAA